MSEAPPIAGIHHVTLSVSDLDRSVAWYRDVLGFEEVRRLSADGLDKAMLVRDGMVLTFCAHGAKAVPGPFDERRCGLDHLSFAVDGREVLERWAARLDAAGAVRSEIKQATTGDLIAFRDPDNIALEFYTRFA